MCKKVLGSVASLMPPSGDLAHNGTLASNGTDDLSVRRAASNPLSHTSQGFHLTFSGHLGCVQVWGGTNSTAENTLVLIFGVLTDAFLTEMCLGATAESPEMAEATGQTWHVDKGPGSVGVNTVQRPTRGCGSHQPAP